MIVLFSCLFLLLFFLLRVVADGGSTIKMWGELGNYIIFCVLSLFFFGAQREEEEEEGGTVRGLGECRLAADKI